MMIIVKNACQINASPCWHRFSICAARAIIATAKENGVGVMGIRAVQGGALTDTGERGRPAGAAASRPRYTGTDPVSEWDAGVPAKPTPMPTNA